MTKKEMEDYIQLYKDQLEFYRSQLESLREENQQLRMQNFSLQDGLLNVRAPEAYQDLQADRVPASEGMTPEEKEKRRVYNEEVANHLQNLERPTFESPDDFSFFMSRILNEDGGPSNKSIHGNDES